MRDNMGDYRGKRVDTGEWVYGFLLYIRSCIGTITSCLIISDYADISAPDIQITDAYDVDPSTVGQYTGLKDKNGKKIYEGDVLLFCKRRVKVVWNGESFSWEVDALDEKQRLENEKYRSLGWVSAETACIGYMTTEVIGDIYDKEAI